MYRLPEAARLLFNKWVKVLKDQKVKSDKVLAVHAAKVKAEHDAKKALEESKAAPPPATLSPLSQSRQRVPPPYTAAASAVS